MNRMPAARLTAAAARLLNAGLTHNMGLEWF